MNVVRRRQSRLLFSSFEGWSRDGISQDILAGLTLAAITIPEQMATAKLGGFEPQIGFYAFIGATIGFVGLGASRVLTAGADSTITPIFAGTLAALAAGSSTTIGSAATTLALLAGVMLLAGGILKLGWIANLLSTPVITGFLAGIAVHIIVSQLPSLFGLAKGAGDLGGQVLAMATNLSRLNLFSTAIGLGVLATMVLTERMSAHIPGALIGVTLAAIVVLVFDLENRGVTVLGALPGGLPRLALPTFDLLRQLIPMALIITLVIMMQTATVTYSFRNSPDQPDGRESPDRRCQPPTYRRSGGVRQQVSARRTCGGGNCAGVGALGQSTSVSRTRSGTCRRPLIRGPTDRPRRHDHEGRTPSPRRGPAHLANRSSDHHSTD